MLSAPFAYLVAIGMLVVCGLVALTLIRTVESLDGDQGGVEATHAPPVPHADAA